MQWTQWGGGGTAPSMFKCKKVTTQCIWLHTKRTPKRTSFICCIFCMVTLLHLSINIGSSPPLLSVHCMEQFTACVKFVVEVKFAAWWHFCIKALMELHHHYLLCTPLPVLLRTSLSISLSHLLGIVLE